MQIKQFLLYCCTLLAVLTLLLPEECQAAGQPAKKRKTTTRKPQNGNKKPVKGKPAKKPTKPMKKPVTRQPGRGNPVIKPELVMINITPSPDWPVDEETLYPGEEPEKNDWNSNYNNNGNGKKQVNVRKGKNKKRTRHEENHSEEDTYEYYTMETNQKKNTFNNNNFDDNSYNLEFPHYS